MSKYGNLKLVVHVSLGGPLTDRAQAPFIRSQTSNAYVEMSWITRVRGPAPDFDDATRRLATAVLVAAERQVDCPPGVKAVEAFQMTKARRDSNEHWPMWMHEAWSADAGSKGSLFPNPNDRMGETLRIHGAGATMVHWGDYILLNSDGSLGLCTEAELPKGPDFKVYDPSSMKPPL